MSVGKYITKVNQFLGEATTFIQKTPVRKFPVAREMAKDFSHYRSEWRRQVNTDSVRLRRLREFMATYNLSLMITFTFHLVTCPENYEQLHEEARRFNSLLNRKFENLVRIIVPAMSESEQPHIHMMIGRQYSRSHLRNIMRCWKFGAVHSKVWNLCDAVEYLIINIPPEIQGRRHGYIRSRIKSESRPKPVRFECEDITSVENTLLEQFGSVRKVWTSAESPLWRWHHGIWKFEVPRRLPISEPLIMRSRQHYDNAPMSVIADGDDITQHIASVSQT